MITGLYDVGRVFYNTYGYVNFAIHKSIFGETILDSNKINYKEIE